MNNILIVSIVSVILYTILNLYVSIGKAYNKEEVSTARGYFIGNGTGMFVIFFTTMASFFSGWVFMGAPASFYQHGVGWLCCMPWMLLFCWHLSKFGPKLWKMSHDKGYITPAELIADYYGSKTLQVIIAVFLLIYGVPNIIAQMSAIGTAFTTISDGLFPFWVGVVYTTIIVGIYVFFGGFKSQAWVDTAQGIMFVIILVISVFFIYFKCGMDGFTAVFESLSKSESSYLIRFDNNGSWPLSNWISYAFIMPTGGYFAPYVWQRMYAAKDGRTLARMSAGLGFLFPFALALPICLCGIGAAAIMPGIANADSVVVAVLNEYQPVMAVVVVLATIAAAMSTISSIVVCASSMISMDIFKVIRPEADSEKCRNIGRVCVLGLLVFSMIMSFYVSSGVSFLVNASFAGFAQMLVPAFCIFYWKRSSKAGIMAGYITGNIVCLFMTLFHPWFLGFVAGIWGIVVNVVVTVVVSLFTRKVGVSATNEFLKPLETAENLPYSA